MANLLTYEQMEFLAKKLRYEIVHLNTVHYYKHYSDNKAILADGTLRSFTDTDDAFWCVSTLHVNDYPKGYEFQVLVDYVKRNERGKRCANTYIQLVPRDFIPACKKYFGGAPLYVGTKRVNQAICKVGGVLKTVQGIYVKKDGGIKKIM